MSKRIAMPLPPEVKVFLNKLSESVGEFCHEAVLSYMLNMVLRGFSRVDQAADSNMADCMITDLTEGGIIDDSLDGISDKTYNTVICEGCAAIYALGYMVRKFRIDESSEITNLRIEMGSEMIIGTIR